MKHPRLQREAKYLSVHPEGTCNCHCHYVIDQLNEEQIPTLLAFGCSFTGDIGKAFTDEGFLHPSNEVKKQKEGNAGYWSQTLMHLTQRNLLNFGCGGVGNYYIASRIYNTFTSVNLNIVRYTHVNPIVVVMWTGMDRVDRMVSKEEFPLYDKIQSKSPSLVRDGWLHSATPPQGYIGMGGLPEYVERYWTNYYKMFHTEQDSYNQTLQHMLGVQQFLTNRNIPYLFLTYKDIFTGRYGKYEETKSLENAINWDKFHFPNAEYGGMLEWVQANEDLIDPWAEDGKHPSKESHKKFAEYLHNLDALQYLFTS